MKSVDITTRMQAARRDAEAAYTQGLAALDAKKRRRSDLEVLPAPRSEFADCVVRWIDERASEYPQAIARELSWFVRRPLMLAESKDGTFQQSSAGGGTARRPAIVTSSARPDSAGSPEAAVLYLMRDQVKKALKQAIEAMLYPDLIGPPMAQRLAEIAKLDKEIAELEIEVKELEAALKNN